MNIPNTERIQALADEKAKLLLERRRWEKEKLDHQANADNCALQEDRVVRRLLVVEAWLEGVDLGVGHAAELAASKTEGTKP